MGREIPSRCNPGRMGQQTRSRYFGRRLAVKGVQQARAAAHPWSNAGKLNAPTPGMAGIAGTARTMSVRQREEVRTGITDGFMKGLTALPYPILKRLSSPSAS